MTSQFAWWAIITAVLIGHFGISIASYNRINGFGFPRQVVKGFSKVLFLLTITLPSLAAYYDGRTVTDLAQGEAYLSDLPGHLLIYAGVCLAAWIALGIPWLIWRPIFGVEWIRSDRDVEVVDVQSTVGRPLAITTRCKLESKLPLNQIFDLAIEDLQLPVQGLPAALDGYRIAHLSDVHLTGDVHPDFTRYVVQRATAWQPDLMTLTGDIIDRQSCIDWLPEIFAAAQAADGCYYVLGNHDTRIVDSGQTRRAMDRAGWTDMGSRTLARTLASVPSLLIGNEYPWFGRPDIGADGDEEFRLLFSHSPDQIGWARRHNITLMLAGHMHGGQGRLPLVGPILGPSFHGSRYASGDFYKPPTTMHVSRGLSGTHLIRINCRPELSLLTLRTAQGCVVDT